MSKLKVFSEFDKTKCKSKKKFRQGFQNSNRLVQEKHFVGKHFFSKKNSPALDFETKYIWTCVSNIRQSGHNWTLRVEWNVLFRNCFFNKFSFLKFPEFIAKWYQKFGNCSMAGLPKLEVACQMNFLCQKNLPMRKLFVYFNSWLSGMKLWLLE